MSRGHCDREDGGRREEAVIGRAVDVERTL